MGQMEDFLASLSDEQKAKFAAALAGENKETPKKRGRPKKDVIILPKIEESEIEDEQEDFIQKPKKKVVKVRMEDDDEEDFGQKRKSSRPKNVSKNRGAGEKICRSQGLSTGPRKNMFLEMPEFNASKELVAEDKAALKRGKPAARMGRATIFEVECVRCHRTYEVGAGLAHKRYVCDGCITGRG